MELREKGYVRLPTLVATPQTRSRRMCGRAMLVVSIVLGCACSVGRQHTPDLVLEERFFRDRGEFEKLLKDVQADDKIEAIQPDGVLYAGKWLSLREPGSAAALERVGLTAERLSRYEEQLGRLRLNGGVMKEHGTVEFRADQGSFSNGDSYKGYVFRTTRPARTLSDLDGYRKSERDRTPEGDWIVYRLLTDRWYLYLFVNH